MGKMRAHVRVLYIYIYIMHIYYSYIYIIHTHIIAGGRWMQWAALIKAVCKTEIQNRKITEFIRIGLALSCYKVNGRTKILGALNILLSLWPQVCHFKSCFAPPCLRMNQHVAETDWFGFERAIPLLNVRKASGFDADCAFQRGTEHSSCQLVVGHYLAATNSLAIASLILAGASDFVT